MVDPNLSRLWELEKNLCGIYEEFRSFGELGIELDKQLECGNYFYTPINSVVFAWTGSDGGHYSFLQIGRPDVYPVVLTSPAAFKETANIILGENLCEFLSLGINCGYFNLEALPYDLPRIIQFINCPLSVPNADNFQPDNWAFLARQLQHIRDEFDLTPWQNIGQKLAELREKYLPMLEIAEWEEYCARNKVDPLPRYS